MPEVVHARLSFNAGEFSPWVDPRVDLEKYRSAARTLTNMEVSPYGGAFRRPGFLYLGTVEDDTAECRLYPFISGDGTAYMLEFGDTVLRIWSTGSSPAPLQKSSADIVITTPWAASDLRQLAFSQLNDLLFICHPDHPPEVLARYSDIKWRLRPFNPDWPALLPTNDTEVTLTVASAAPTPAAWSDATTYAAGDQVTRGGKTYTSRANGNVDIEPAVDPDWKSWWRFRGSATYDMGARVDITASADLFETGDVDGKWKLSWIREDLDRKIFVSTASAPSTTGKIFCLGTWSADLSAEVTGTAGWEVSVIVQRSYDGESWETRSSLAGSSSSVQSLITGFEEQPCFLRLKLVTKTGTVPAQYHATLTVSNPEEFGLVKIISRTSATVVRAVVEFPLPDNSATTLWQAAAWSSANGYPAAITIHQNRLFFAGTKTSPATVWGSRIDRFGDFRLDDEADAAVEYVLASESTTRVRWLMSSNDLLAGAHDSEWAIGIKGSERTIRARRHTMIGSPGIQPVMVDDAVLYIQRSRRKVREFTWNYDRSRYTSQDLTILAEHMGDSVFRSITVQRNPDTRVYLCRADGSLAVLTYDRSQQITGWTTYTTPNGSFESVAAVDSGNNKDEIWAVIVRTIDGSTVRYIERMDPAVTRTLKSVSEMTGDLSYMDCAVVGTCTGNSITSLSTSLDVLEGETVGLLKEGVYLGNYTVSSGLIDISDIGPLPTGSVLIGKIYNSIVSPTYLEFDDPKFSSKAGKKRVTRAILELYKSRGGEITANEARDFTNMNEPTLADAELFSGLLEEYTEGNTERQATVRIRNKTPYPFNLLSLTLRYELETS